MGSTALTRAPRTRRRRPLIAAAVVVALVGTVAA